MLPRLTLSFKHHSCDIFHLQIEMYYIKVGKLRQKRRNLFHQHCTEGQKKIQKQKAQTLHFYMQSYSDSSCLRTNKINI